MEKKIAIISGASRGIGRAVAVRLAKEHYFVIVLARNAEEVTELEFEIDSNGGKALAFAVDIADEQQVNSVIEQVLRDFGRIDVVINNAGIGIFKSAEAFTAEEWSRLMDVNVKGSFLLTKAVLPAMKAAGSGHIVAIASDVSKRTFPQGSLYCASKYAQDAFFSALRKEVRPDKIKVSVIYPGLVDTFFHEGEPGQPHRSYYLQAQDIADATAYILNTPPHVVIDELMIHPLDQNY